MKPKRAKNADVMAMLAALNRRLVKMRTGSMGSATESSQRMNAVRSVSETTKPSAELAEAQPHSGASMMVNTNAPIAATESSRPGRSSLGAWLSLDSGTSQTAAAIATATTGRLTKKTDPHQ